MFLTAILVEGGWTPAEVQLHWDGSHWSHCKGSTADLQMQLYQAPWCQDVWRAQGAWNVKDTGMAQRISKPFCVWSLWTWLKPLPVKNLWVVIYLSNLSHIHERTEETPTASHQNPFSILTKSWDLKNKWVGLIYHQVDGTKMWDLQNSSHRSHQVPFTPVTSFWPHPEMDI